MIASRGDAPAPCGGEGDRAISRMNTPPDGLRAAYEATSYHVPDTPVGPLTIRCGCITEELDRLLDVAGSMTWAFVSAANPGSVRLDPSENLRRHEALLHHLRRHALPCHFGVGIGDDGSWPAEESVLVLGLDETAALSLGRTFGQRAVVVGERGRPARLAWITPGETGPARR